MNPGSQRASGELVRAYPTTRLDVESEIVAQTERSRAVLDQLDRLAQQDDHPPGPVLICGETGTGKTVCAQLLHARRAQADLGSASLTVVNCAALSDALLSDLLFELDRARAHGRSPGTLFLDEVGELSPWGQAALLHRLHVGLGATRLLTATHRNVDLMARQGAFSRELLLRLSASRIQLAPLRARREDIAPLAMHFLRIGLRAHDLRFVSVQPELFRQLERYDWPGNVRELRSAMLTTLAINESGTLTVADLPDTVRTCVRPELAKRR